MLLLRLLIFDVIQLNTLKVTTPCVKMGWMHVADSLPTSVTFEALATDVLSQKSVLSRGTYLKSQILISRLVRHFGKMPLTEISEVTWREYVLARQARKPGCKLFDDKKFMKMILLEGFRRGLIPRVPPRLWIPDRPSTVGREITDAELARLFEHANPLLRFQMEIALKMGLRLREVLHLRWDRIHWDEQTIRLRPEDTKTRKGRIIPIPPELFRQFEERISASSGPYVFPSRLDPSRPQHENKTAWRALRSKANVRTRWHDFRHSCASRLLRMNVPPNTVRAYLGMTERILTNIYQHLNLDDLRKASNAMSLSWNPQGNK